MMPSTARANINGYVNKLTNKLMENSKMKSVKRVWAGPPKTITPLFINSSSNPSPLPVNPVIY